jgi:hypothetical protein
MDLTVNQSLTLTARCPTAAPAPGQSQSSQCSVSGSASVYIYGFLEDFTNASGVAATNYWTPLLNDTSFSKYTNCYSSGCSTSTYSTHSQSGNGTLTGHTAFTWMINATGPHAINASHKYGFVLSLSASVSVAESGSPYGFVGGHAYEVLDLATGGNSWKLIQLQIS